MLTIHGRAPRQGGFCDGMARRDFLKIGGMVMGGLSLPQLLAAEAQAARTSSAGFRPVARIFAFSAEMSAASTSS